MADKRAQGVESGSTDDYDFAIVSQFEGYNSSLDKTNIAPGFLIRGSKNVYKKLSGTIASRPGLKLRGAVDATLAGTSASFEWNNSLGNTLPVRVNNGKLQVETDIVTSGTPVWYSLLTGLTKTRWVFDSWWDNTNKKDVLLMVDGTSTLRNWSGAMALFVSATATVVTLDRDATTAGFSASGSVVISGVTYTYSGRSGSTLTGMSSDVSATPVNTPIFEAVGSTATTPASGFLNDFIKVINNQLYVGSYTSRLVYISKNSSYTDYSQSTPRLSGEGDLLTLDNNCKGITARNGNAWISAGTSDWYEVTFNQITVGAVISEQTKVDKKPTSYLSAALGHEFIDNIGAATIVALCQDHQVRLIGTFTNQFQDKYPSISLAIKDELKDEDFTGGHLRAIGDIIYISAPLSGRDYMHETREQLDPLGRILSIKFWHPPQVRNVARFAVISGEVYGHSNAYPQLYQVWNTNQWHDDSPSGVPLPYDVYARFAYQQNGRRQGKTKFDKMYLEGYMTEGTALQGNLLYDYQGATSVAYMDLNTSGQAKFYSGNQAPSLGDGSLGDNPLGDGLTVDANDQELLPKFRLISSGTLVDCFEYATEIFTQAVDSRWEILAIGVNAQLSENEPLEIILRS